MTLKIQRKGKREKRILIPLLKRRSFDLLNALFTHLFPNGSWTWSATLRSILNKNNNNKTTPLWLCWIKLQGSTAAVTIPTSLTFLGLSIRRAMPQIPNVWIQPFSGGKKPKQKNPNTFKTLGHWMCYSTLMTGGAGWRQCFHHLLPWEETIMLYWLMATPCWSLQKRGHTGVETWSLIDGNIKAIDRRRWPFHDVNTQLLLLGTV